MLVTLRAGTPWNTRKSSGSNIVLGGLSVEGEAPCPNIIGRVSCEIRLVRREIGHVRREIGSVPDEIGPVLCEIGLLRRRSDWSL